MIVLQIPRLFKLDESFLTELKEILPIFNREGRYLDRLSGKSWIEINKKAYEYSDYKTTKFELEILEHKRIRENIYNSLIILNRENLLTKELKKTLIIENHIRKQRETKIEITKVFLK